MALGYRLGNGVLLSLVCTASLLAADDHMKASATRPARGDLVSLALHLDPAAGTLSGIFKAPVPKWAVDKQGKVSVLLNHGLVMDAISTESGAPCRFTSERTKIEGLMEVIHVEADCPDALQRMVFRYSGRLKNYAKTMKYVKDAVSPGKTIIRFDALAYPLLAEPTVSSFTHALTAQSFHYELHVISKERLPIVAPGRQVSLKLTEDGATARYESTVATNSIFVVQGDYGRIENGEHVWYALGDHSDGENATIAASIEKVWRLYTELLGAPCHPMPTLIENFTGYGGSMAPGFIIVEAKDLRAASLRYLYHEIGHCWQPLKAPDWVSEGLADFLSLVAVAKLESEAGASKRWKAAEAEYARFCKAHPDQKGVRGGRDTAYCGGSLFVRQLADEVGLKTLGATMRAFESSESMDYAGFARTASRVSGKELSHVFKQWEISE